MAHLVLHRIQAYRQHGSAMSDIARGQAATTRRQARVPHAAAEMLFLLGGVQRH
ncbi:protein of unknown function [Sterolibacterium denitrificans]|uniref:Uncharacterized protein n=1 Tax=Sterolibacterium denitrificans TaxID=157592 RepID=A0A7Z7HSR8_9PROT|nr:protein of unknown function [Sterolibacterium denitrificans]